MKNKSKQYIVVHAGRRDDYQIAQALLEAGLLKCLVTEFYSPLDNLIGKLLCRSNYLKNKLLNRYKIGLSSEKVTISYMALCYFLLFHFTKQIKYDNYKNLALGRKARSISLKSDTPIISMNTYASSSFTENPISPKILFQFHPHPTFVKQLLMEEMNICPKASISLSKEYEFSLSEIELKKLSKEIWLVDYIICASSITKQSLLAEGIADKKIKVIPYGVDLEKFKYLQRPEPDPLFRVIFIGSLNQRKGIVYLLDALNSLKNIELLIVGRGIFDETLLSDYNFKISLYHDVSHEKLLSLLQQSHCFVLPSIIEGFGQVILEAMATGIPVIASMNTAAADIITHTKDGFIVPIRDSSSISDHISLLQANSDLARKIGKAGYETSQLYTWKNFRSGIVNFLISN